MASPTHLDCGESPSEDSAGFNQSPKLTTIDLVGGIRCHICLLTFANKKQYDGHYTTHNTGSADIVYACVICNKEIVGYPSFRGHCYATHVIKNKYKCKYCSKFMSKNTALQEHINAKHNFKCSNSSCKKQFPSQKELHLHQIIHINKGNKPPYQCQTCKKQIDNFDSCENHIDEHCQLTYSCPICNEAISRTNATEHLTKHFGDILNDDNRKDADTTEISEDSSINIAGGILCCVCNDMYKNRSDFDSHFVADHDAENIIYSCNICKKTFQKYSLFGDHCYNHFSKDRFECDECAKSFCRLPLLVLHTEMFHDARAAAKPFTCERCAHSFMSSNRYREHMRLVHDVQQVCCPKPGCTRAFEAPKDLIMHLKDHQTLDNWCRQCGLQFITLASCEKHLDVHKKKLYSCPVCSRQYGEKYLLMKHITQHFESVFHMCKVCGKIYNAKNRLVEHVKTHSTVKSYECKYCGKGFAKSNHLEQHLHMHTGTMPYKCTECSKKFGTYPNFHKHMRKMHNIDSKTMKKSVVDKLNGDMDLEENFEKSIEPNIQTDISISTNVLTYEFKNDESTMDSDSIDPIIIEKESQIFEADLNSLNTNSGIIELTNVIPVNNYEPEASPDSSNALPTAPREYGPDFVNTGVGLSHYTDKLIDLDDHFLPHIDPLLTLKTHDLYVNNIQYQYDNQFQYEPMGSNSGWEPPMLTKVYGNWELDDIAATRLSVMNTDIF